MIDYNNPDAVARQNVSPNAGCIIDGVFHDVRNCIHELATLRAENERMREKLGVIASDDWNNADWVRDFAKEVSK